jgi:Protein of unknown function, DUF255
MELESFESKSVADILNTHFVAIKVDREERPDVDKVYVSPSSPCTMHVFKTVPLIHAALARSQWPQESRELFCHKQSFDINCKKP